MTDVADDLKRVPLFAELNGRQLNKLGAKFRERSFEPVYVSREGGKNEWDRLLRDH